MSTTLAATAAELVSEGRGILAADETVATVTKRLARVGIVSTPESRREYRELFFTTPGIAAYISGVILHDETIRQRSSDNTPFAEQLTRQGILPGIKVDRGVVPLAGCPGEYVTEGLDGLRDRLAEYAGLGARFAKWRGVIPIGDQLPTPTGIRTNAHALARYAALCEEAGLVPIVEPEVLMDGTHTLERSTEVTGRVLHEVFEALYQHGVTPEGILLKPNMVVPGLGVGRRVPPVDVAEATLRCLRRHVPAAVAGIVFLSGGQSHLEATANLSAINGVGATRPWPLTFSFGRALQDEALASWRGRPANVVAAQRAFYHRARCVSAAAVGRYTPAMEQQSAVA
jgi:fructose-bisphosphate aldolase class I